MTADFTEVRLQMALGAARMEVWDSVVVDNNVTKGDVFWSGGGATLLGLPALRREQRFTEFFEFVHPDDRDYVLDVLQTAVINRSEYQLEYRVVWPDRSLHWLAAKARVMTDQDGQPARTLGIIWDVTSRRNAEMLMAEQKELAEVTLGSIGDGVITTDAVGVVTFLNRAAEDLTGWPVQAARGQPVELVFKVIDETSRQPIENIATRCLRLSHTVVLSPRGALVARNGRESPIQDSAAPIRSRDGHVLGAVVVFHDVSAERQLRHELSFQASHDMLTGLINRREFEVHVATALTQARHDNARHALLFLDLDQFKVVNDTCGHVAGDELLRQIANLLQSKMREADVLARLGGDELGVLLRNCPVDQAHCVADNLRVAVKDFRFIWGGQTFEIGVSIGLVVVDADSKSLAEVLSAADRACYVAKEQGRNRVHFYQESDIVLAQRYGEMLWVVRLNDAFEQKRFQLYYQPIVSLNGSVVDDHVEILIRMLDERGEIVLPGAFIPAAERYDLMATMDRWVIESVFGHIGRSTEPANDMAPRRIGTTKNDFGDQEVQADDSSRRRSYSINLSGISLNDDQLMRFIADQFNRHGVAPEQICFEITETAAIGNLTKAKSFMHDVKGMGCKFALDDFGSGLSSFAYLKNLPVDYLKIDGSFVRDVATDPIIRAMVASINQVGHVMGIKTVAEFVETDLILQQVQEIGIDYAQGFAVGRPRRLS